MKKVLYINLIVLLCFKFGTSQNFDGRLVLSTSTPKTLTVQKRNTSSNAVMPATGVSIFTLSFQLNDPNSKITGVSITDYTLGMPDANDLVFMSSSNLASPEDWPMNTWIDVITYDVDASSVLADFTITMDIDGDNADLEDPVISVADAQGFNQSVAIEASILPIKLHNFELIKLDDRGVKLGWSTSSEINGSHFEIHRSTDANNWEYIGEVAAVGESTMTQEYDFIDENVGLLRSNTTFYYRLKMFDKDGTFEYSEIRSVTFDVDGVSITTFPNPTSDVIRVNMISDADLGAPDSDAYIMDNTGRILTKKKISSNGITEIDLNELPSGILMLQVLHNNKTYTHKIIKVD